MLPNMKFYVVSIVAIFTALGLGIYIGFAMDTEGFITDQQENLVNIVETQFENIIKENKELVKDNEILISKNKEKNDYINDSYNLLLENQLQEKKIALIETNDEYVNSGIGRDIEEVGGSVLSLTTIKNLEKTEIQQLTNAILNGDNNKLIQDLFNSGKIEILGNYEESIDYLVLSGGSKTENTSKVISVDKTIIDIAKTLEKNVIGIEKSYVGNSYIRKYKEYGITSIDNTNMKMGKIATVLAFDSKIGSYGIKGTAQSVLPFE